MLRVRPVSEQEAQGEIKEMYTAIKQAVGSPSVPIIFQYLAAFPAYFSFLWKQAQKNIADHRFQQEAHAISHFGQMAMQTCYRPSAGIEAFIASFRPREEHQQLMNFVRQLLTTNSLLYLLALAVRESLKGKYLGLKQIGFHLSEEQRKQFFTVSDAFPPSPPASAASSSMTAAPTDMARIHGSDGALMTTPYGHFFSRMEKEMKELIKKEQYLTRRVELERFSLGKLYLLPSPLDSSFVSVTIKSAEHPHFADLLYLLSDVFPTETPYKLLSACIMERALTPPERQKPSTELAGS